MKVKLTIAALAASLLMSVAQAEDTASATDEQLETFITEATKIFEKNQANPKKRIPDEVLKEADAIMIFRITRGGIILGASEGAGIAFKNNIESWSPPAFYTVASGSLGLQIGASEMDLIAVLMNHEAEGILDDPKINWGVGMEVIAGPTGASLGANTMPKADILIYETTKGLDVGVAVSGGLIQPNQKFNAELYDKDDITTAWILGSRVPMPKAAESLTLLLRDYSYQAPKSDK
ncbi:lipid-binding SYLF domain-containing protein [Cerasicoccus maritimus]|uniref:lipid-binding SYLF domain-containing protein n=1 Tax=Cerasicoccus maritimus TaxID=490089 RepID=UPI002852B0A7|nr:lipid-binding SYLF domain-containing protein [Cerasicoccus maritimus]